MSIPAPPPIARPSLPRLSVEVIDESSLLRSRLTLASNWFAVNGLRITRRLAEVRLHRDDRLIVHSNGGSPLFVGTRPLRAHRIGFWRRVWMLPLGEGRMAEIINGRNGVHAQVRVTPGDARLEVIDTSGGFRRGCRVELVSGLVETEIALALLVYFLAEIEDAYRHNA
jgi:hypothetical protein